MCSRFSCQTRRIILSGIDTDLVKVLLDEQRKTNDKIDSVRQNVYDKMDEIEDRIDNRLIESSKQHTDLFVAQEKMVREHIRMNDLLEEHIKRTEIAEGNIDKISQTLGPIAQDYNERQVVDQYSTKTWKKVALLLGITSTAIGA